jgi:hypothetical protein
MGIVESKPSRAGRSAQLLFAALAAVIVVARPSAAGPITGKSWDGPLPGTLAEISGQADFMFGAPAFSAGVYAITWGGGVTAWRNWTTIGAGDQVLFDPGPMEPGTTHTITMADPWTLWGTTPDLAHAESTGDQWAFVAVSDDTWIWGLEDMLMGHCDCDYQDAYGVLTLIGGGSSTLGAASLPPLTQAESPLATDVQDSAVAVIPEPATVGLVALGLAGLVWRRRASR